MTYELVLDNTKMLANCFEFGPFTVDLGLRNTQLDFAPFTSNFMGLSDTDESSEIIIPNGNHSAYSDGYWAGEDHGDVGYPTNIFLPDVPEGYTLTHATYVVKAYREFANDPPASDWGPDYGSPTTFPFLYIDSAGTSDYHSFLDLPIGGYAGETLATPNSEFLSRIVELGSVAHFRMWLGRGHYPDDISPIHVAYFALRLTYEIS